MSPHCLNQQHLHIIRHTVSPCVQLCLLDCTVVTSVLSPSLSSAFSISFQAFSVSVLVPVSMSALVSVLSQYPLPLQSSSVLDPRLCQHPPGFDTSAPRPRLCFPSWNHAFVCPASPHACLTTTTLNIPYCPCLPCNDPCLSDIATATNKTSVILPKLGLAIGSSVRLPEKNKEHQ